MPLYFVLLTAECFATWALFGSHESTLYGRRVGMDFRVCLFCIIGFSRLLSKVVRIVQEGRWFLCSRVGSRPLR